MLLSTNNLMTFKYPGDVERMQMLYTCHDALATKDSVGPMFNSRGQMLSYARPRGEMPDCTPAPKDKTWLEEQKIFPPSTTELYLSAMRDFANGHYHGTFRYWAEFWDRVKEEAGISRTIYPGTA